MTTDELVKKCKEKDTSAWDEFTRRYTHLVKRSVLYKLRKLGLSYSKDEALDIVQEVFLLIWEKDKLTLLKSPSSLKGWLAIVSINITSNYCRKYLFRSQRDILSLNAPRGPEPGSATLEDLLSSDKLNTERTLEANELKRVLNEELSRLPQKQELALKFNIYDGEKQSDIARIMNIPEGTVATLIKRGKDTLRERLKSYLNP